LSKWAKWDCAKALKKAEQTILRCKKLEVRVLFHFEDEYPELLRQITDPPYMLFCRGNVKLLSGKNISIVGTRKISPVGKKAALEFAKDAANDGCNVVSGLASGVDAYAHQGALNAYFDALEKDESLIIGKTIAVLPSAIDEILPAVNKKLAGQILFSGGLLISEYEPAESMAKWHFVGRNRIIAALSMATLVVEAPTGSGALITADFAVEYNRDVLFHEACFSESAEYISSLVKSKLDRDFAIGMVSKYKIENTPEKYIRDGAPVIKDYKNFCEVLSGLPGSQNKPEQGELFD
jgi:DNA processing protein